MARPGYRRQGDCQSHRPDPLRRPDAALQSRQEAAAQAIEQAVAQTLAEGYLTADLHQASATHPVQSTADMGSQIAARI